MLFKIIYKFVFVAVSTWNITSIALSLRIFAAGLGVLGIDASASPAS